MRRWAFEVVREKSVDVWGRVDGTAGAKGQRWASATYVWRTGRRRHGHMYSSETRHKVYCREDQGSGEVEELDQESMLLTSARTCFLHPKNPFDAVESTEFNLRISESSLVEVWKCIVEACCSASENLSHLSICLHLQHPYPASGCLMSLLDYSKQLRSVLLASALASLQPNPHIMDGVILQKYKSDCSAIPQLKILRRLPFLVCPLSLFPVSPSPSLQPVP